MNVGAALCRERAAQQPQDFGPAAQIGEAQPIPENRPLGRCSLRQSARGMLEVSESSHLDRPCQTCDTLPPTPGGLYARWPDKEVTTAALSLWMNFNKKPESTYCHS